MTAELNSDLILSTRFRITSADTDMEARLRIGALFNFLIQSAIQSADALGFGFGNLRQEKLFWVLSKMTVLINRPLKWYEEIRVDTWPKDIDGLTYLRDFRISDKEGNIVALATSGWLAVNLETKRPSKVADDDIKLFNRLREVHAINSLPEKLAQVRSQRLVEIPVSYFDIDLNKHVTSTRYVDWMMDSLPLEFVRSHYPEKISVNYMKETQLGEEVLLHIDQNDENVYLFDGVHKSKDVSSFRGRIEFRKIAGRC